MIKEVPSSEANREFLNLSEIRATLNRGRWVILATVLTGMLGSSIVSFLQPNIFTATATIMPVDSSSDRLSSALSSLGALGTLASQAGAGLKGTTSDKFVGFLESRTLTENVITRHHLLPSLFPERWDEKQLRWIASPLEKLLGQPAHQPTRHEALERLEGLVAAKADIKTGLIRIDIEHRDPQIAADIANDYVTELNIFLQGNTFTAAKQNRDFLQRQTEGVAKELAVMENNVKAFQEAHKLVSLDAQTQASVQAYADLKSRLITKEMELSLLSKSVTQDDVQLVGVKQEVEQLKAKIEGIENGDSQGLVAFKDAPSLGMRFSQLKRDLLIKEKVFELLTQQLELAKVDEAKEAFSFQVIDRAIAPEKKTRPKRMLNVLASTLASLLLGALLTLFVGRREARQIRLSS